MNCPKCGSLNETNSKFCIRCGGSLINQTQTVIQTSIQPNQYVSGVNSVSGVQSNYEVNNQQNIQYNQSINNEQINLVQNENTNKISFISYLFIILSVILKPFTSFKEEKNKFTGFKNSIILSLIVTGFATIITLINKMISIVIVKTLDYKTGKLATEWVFKNLKDLKYVDIIGKNILLYLGIIFAVAGLYYIASLIVKKQCNFSRLIAISSIAIVPFSICSLILNPIISIFSIKFGLIVTLIGVIYTFLLMYEGINDELKLVGNVKYYLNLACISILCIVGMIILFNSFTSSITNDLNSFSNLFS